MLAFPGLTCAGAGGDAGSEPAQCADRNRCRRHSHRITRRPKRRALRQRGGLRHGSAGAGRIRTQDRATARAPPSTLAPVIVLASVSFGAAIVAEASLSLSRAGRAAARALVGRHAQRTQPALPHAGAGMAIFPGLAISLVIFGVNMFGDALRMCFDPAFTPLNSGKEARRRGPRWATHRGGGDTCLLEDGCWQPVRPVYQPG